MRKRTTSIKARGQQPPARISLIDLVYGAVIALAFDRFDLAVTKADLLRWSFSFLVVSIDWVYVHRKYWDWDYKYNSVFIFDLLILFFMSRLFSPSVLFWLWMGLIYVCYAIWDILARRLGLMDKKEFLPSFGWDLATASVFVTAFVMTKQSMIVNSMKLDAVLMVIYAVAWRFGQNFEKGNALQHQR